MSDDRTTVEALFAAASVTVPPDELERFVRVYPTLRAQADAMYDPVYDAEEPAVAFDPTVGFGA